MAALLIKNGRVIDPASGLDAVRDVLIEEGKIKFIKTKLHSTKAKIIDAKGKLVLPGLIDMHTHLRDPGRPDKETIASGTRAAARGGFTTVCCMANTEPVLDSPALIEYIRTKAAATGMVNVYPIGAVSKGLAGEELVEMGLMAEEGAVAFSDDGKPIMKADMMRRALEYSKQFGLPIIAHCEDRELAHGGAMNEGALSTAIGLPGIPALSEEIMVARDVMLAKHYGQVHIAHVSSGKSVDIIRQAKKKNSSVSCETCPHYFSLTEEAVANYDTNAKVNPPLKTAQDVAAVIKGLKDGTIDVIATDHAPHNVEEKKVEFNRAAFGLVGLETALALVLTKLVNTKHLTLKEAVAKLTSAPAKILNFKNKGRIAVGADADVIIVDPKSEWEVDPLQFASKSKNTPFTGWKLQGKVLFTIVGGKVVVRDGKLQD
ncbi:dihydroorotase [candidate division WOR-1 bacterium RIFOXYB2_FULL_42_35]|uniref:Dihydroorotase n=1 Tax=candidate division WOR-1 bacterium RIFOXYC2_FULL_41_25 TaxID=1802586 RepID=A0A1F4TL95_UNCSA|nr:MAG: dihydroorotase [candidate division WOR-1 bacterium RIFOXYA2_FULL_41_14]OGC23030.1 MAG: dihydroorotase [candidate division WOR-1 bacterium RIFOXYB2_FULL_42_35]OGC33488.1 MAG: dihydroorotase [candidate division WOR-1 bacterium RIFOXYC2_FULL_41_25]OGC44055.1 MAG: dihydroorotase [candidate division WOR-1 bacterium RIFOXYD2_FULL_41_8]